MKEQNLDEHLDAFEAVLTKARGISPALMQRASERLAKAEEDEKELGHVHSLFVRSLWVAGDVLYAESNAKSSEAVLQTSEIEEMDVKREAVRLKVLADLARELFWAETTTQLTNGEPSDLAVRSGWIVVAVPQRRPNIAQMFGLPAHG